MENKVCGAFSEAPVSEPRRIDNPEYRYDAFDNGKTVLGKKKGHLPPMGWNSWNAFGSGNTETLTRATVDSIIRLGLDKKGYKYIVLDDGCYKEERVDGRLVSSPERFPGGFNAIGDYVHEKGLLFGMYNDIGPRLCSGAHVGTCGYEAADAESYADWNIDFIKVDNCYYLWDNATFSEASNAKYVFAPAVKGIRIEGFGLKKQLSAVKDGEVTGTLGKKHTGGTVTGADGTKEYPVVNGCELAAYFDGAVTGIGTYDGTGPGPSPLGEESSELVFRINAPADGEYSMKLCYADGEEEGIGSWLQAAVGEKGKAELFYDDFLPATQKDGEEGLTFAESPAILIRLSAGENIIRIMNHRRQENTLYSYSMLLSELNKKKPGHDIVFSICEWGKTQPQNWGYKVGDSWRILNDITFRVGSDGDPGYGSWKDDYTPSVTTQYNKAVIMDEFAGPDKGWNDPDMLMVGMNGLTPAMNRTHFAAWCMMNAPLMLGLDLRRVEKGDEIYEIIANGRLIALNRDPLGIQAKRIYSTLEAEHPDTVYIRNIDRVDILAKPLADGGVALSFINVSEEDRHPEEGFSVDKGRILAFIGKKMTAPESFAKAEKYIVTDLWSGEETTVTGGVFAVSELAACDNVTIKIMPYAE